MKEYKDIYTVFLNYIIIFTGALCFYYVGLNSFLGSLDLFWRNPLIMCFFFFYYFLNPERRGVWWAKTWFPAIMNNIEKNGEEGKIKQANA